MSVVSTNRAVRSRGGRNLLAEFLRHVAKVRKTHRDIARLETMRDDQLRDIGLNPADWKRSIR